MFFKKKTRNRRMKRDNVLEVKLRSQQVRKERLKLASGLIAVCLTLAIGGLVIWRGGEWFMNKLVYENDAFAILNVDVKTDGVISPEYLKRWARVKRGDNLLALDLKQVKRDLELAPIIQNVSVERVFPHTLRIRVAERFPVAQVYTLRRPVNSTRYEPFIQQLDANGYVILPVDNRLRAEPVTKSEWYPTITGVPASELRTGKKVEMPQILSALQMIVAFEGSPMYGLVDLKNIDVSEAEVLKVTTSQGNEIIFRQDDFNSQFQRWRLAYDYAHRVGHRIGLLDLSVTNNVPTLWARQSDAPVPAPKVKSNRNRRKNV